MSAIKINIVLFGIGNVGSTLLKQVLESQQFFTEKKNLEVRFPVITNSSLAFFEKNGVKNSWEANFTNASIPYQINQIIDYVKNENIENVRMMEIWKYKKCFNFSYMYSRD